MKKIKIVNFKRFLIFVILLSLIGIFLTLFLLNNVSAHDSQEYKSIIIYSGDTLWTIAEKEKPNKDIRQYIHEIRDLNNLNDAHLIIGQEILIPIIH